MQILSAFIASFRTVGSVHSGQAGKQKGAAGAATCAATQYIGEPARGRGASQVAPHAIQSWWHFSVSYLGGVRYPFGPLARVRSHFREFRAR